MSKKNYKSYLGNATAFYESAKLLSENCNKNLLINNYKSVAYFIFAVVNYSFSCELILKAVLYKYNISYNKIHLLYDLFNIYPLDLKNYVYQKFKEDYKIEKLEFEKKLMSISGAFVDWRYFVFECKDLHIDNNFLINFSKVIYEQAISLI